MLQTNPIQCNLYPNRLSELAGVSKQIKDLINEGTHPSQICIIAPKHALLKDLVPFLQNQNIPIYYEKRSNVLDSEIIKIVLTIAQFVAYYNADQLYSESLLPKILAHPSFGIDTVVIWKLAIQAKDPKISWSQCILESDFEDVKEIFIWLLELSQKYSLYPGEMVLDYIIGTNTELYVDEDNYSEVEPQNPDTTEIDLKTEFKSQLKNYYFQTDKNGAKYSPKYLTFLTDLRVLYQTIRSQNTSQASPDLAQILELVNFYQANNQAIVNNNPLNRTDTAVNLMSVHKVKGLEYEHVFVINFIQDCWLPKKRGSVLSLPKYLNLGAESENRDDHMRLIYVAMTRARDFLYVSSYSEKEDGKTTVPLDLAMDWTEVKTTEIDAINSLETINNQESTFMISTDLKDLLSPLVENYKLSVTHYNTFVDDEDGGPLAFIERHLLNFPQAKSNSATYGTAIHEALSAFHCHYLNTGEHANFEVLMKWFEKAWEKQHPPENIYLDYLENRARPNLKTFIEAKGQFLDKLMETEKDFAHENVTIGEAKIKGKIDRLEKNLISKLINVVDYKTGKALTSLDKGSQNEKKKAQKMKNQLMFYKLLVENSRTYSGFKVDTGVLEFVHAKPDQIVLEWEINERELEEFKVKVQEVYSRIVNLDF